jgi:hypothetical protein
MTLEFIKADVVDTYFDRCLSQDEVNKLKQ